MRIPPLLLLIAAMAILSHPLAAQDAMEVPAFVSSRIRLVLRPGDQLTLGRLDACQRPVGLAEARIEAVFPDSILLHATAGRLLLSAGAGDALASGYLPATAFPEPTSVQQVADVVSGLGLAVGGGVFGAIGGVFTWLLLLMLAPLEPLMIGGAIVGAIAGLGAASEIQQTDYDKPLRVSNAWGQLELRRDVRAAACDFRPAP